MPQRNCPFCKAPLDSTQGICPYCGQSIPPVSPEHPEGFQHTPHIQQGQPTPPVWQGQPGQPTQPASPVRPVSGQPQTYPTGNDAGKSQRSNKLLIVLAIVIPIVLLGGGFALYKALTTTDSTRIDSALKAVYSQKYSAAFRKCEKLFEKSSTLDIKDLCSLAICYAEIAEGNNSEVAEARSLTLIRKLVQENNSRITKKLDANVLGLTNDARLELADELYRDGETDAAQALCAEVYGHIKALNFEQKCSLAALFAAIYQETGKLDTKNKCVYLYKETIADDKEKAKSRYARTDSSYGTSIAALAKSSSTKKTTPSVYVNPSLKSVIINGSDVRLRLGPNLNSQVYSDEYGPIHPYNGEYLKYDGETEDFYRVIYDGYTLWVSKLYAIGSSNYYSY